MLVRFKESGYSPEIGDFRAGEKREISEAVARVFIARGLAEEVKTEKAPSGKGEKEG